MQIVGSPTKRKAAQVTDCANSPQLTELEGAILGVVSTREPCSAYVVRRRFERTPTWGWSTSRGAIYPAVKRLIGKNLLRSEGTASARRTDLLSLTDHGREALRSWLLGIAAPMGYIPIDPLRTRVSYLAALDGTERTRFLDEGEAYIARALEVALESPTDPDVVDRWALEASRLGLRMQLEAKLAWWRAVRAIVPD